MMIHSYRDTLDVSLYFTKKMIQKSGYISTWDGAETPVIKQRDIYDINWLAGFLPSIVSLKILLKPNPDDNQTVAH